MIVSFAWTSPALVTGHKTVTRRDWKLSHAQKFYEGQLVDAYDTSPRAHGQRIATIRIHEVYRENTRDMPDEDYEGEGFAFLYEHKQRRYGFTPGDPRAVLVSQASPAAFQAWRERAEDVWVVRFELVELTDAGRAIAERYT